MLPLTALPVDILILILETLGLKEFAVLSRTCHLLHLVVSEYGWSTYLRTNPRPSHSLSKTRKVWPTRVSVRYDVATDSAWFSGDFIARPLSRVWNGKLQPVLAISNSRLIVGAGSNLYSYIFGVAEASYSAPPIIFEGSISLLENPSRTRNITALTFIDDAGLDQTLDVAFQNGVVERVFLLPPSNKGDRQILSSTRSEAAPMLNGDFVESLSSVSNTTLSLSANGSARLSSIHSDPSNKVTSSVIELRARSWISHLCLQSSTPYAAFGVASTSPLNVHAITDGGQLSTHPIAVLRTARTADMLLDKLPSSAVYGLSRAPLNSPWGSSPQILVSGWYDGQVRCYDLRSATQAFHDDSSGINEKAGPALRPVLSLVDRWSYEPIYSVSCGGGSSAHIAAGTARHSVVSFWDVRSPSTGWNVHAPGNDSSPVYSVVLESSRFFGVTQSRPFVFDFGPGVSLDTYPPIPQVRGIDNLKQKKGSNRATYHVHRYPHNTNIGM